MILEARTHAQCEVFDANGVQLMYCTWCDTETGEAVHLVKGDDGKFEMTIDENRHRVVKTEWRQHPAPLRWVDLRSTPLAVTE